MNPDIMKTSIGFGGLVCVTTVAVNILQGGWDATVSKKKHQSMNTLGVSGMEVPEHVSVGSVRGWMPLVGSIQGRKFDRISDEEDWSVVEDEILVSSLRFESDSAPTEVAYRVSGPALRTDR